MKNFFMNDCFDGKRNSVLRKTVALLVILATLFALCSCSDDKAEQSLTDSSETSQTSVLHTDTPQNSAASEPAVKVTMVHATSPFPEKVDSGEIRINEFGKFSGEYVEDGSDRPIENVAAIRVTNRSKRFLDFATITVKINNNPATFVVTGLPAGKCTWVLEQNCMTIPDKAAFEFIDCSTSFSDDDIISSSDKLSIKSDGNYMTVSNLTDQKLHNVVVYYRNLHDDGNYLGGITYRVTVGSINANETAKVIAGHYSEKNSEIVRIDF